MTKTERLEKIIDYAKQHKSATILELANMLDVSHMTIRRDIVTLVEKNTIKVIHGGVIYQEDNHAATYQMTSARTNMFDAKQRIAKKAVTLIEPDDIIIIDAGSTGELIASFLPEGFPITVVCYALNIATIVASRPNCSLIVTGGYYHESSMILESKEGLDLLKQNRANKAFITASGVSDSLGITCSNFFERATKHAALQTSHKGILVADSSKFGLIKTGHFADIDDFDVVITDSDLDENLTAVFSHNSNLKFLLV